MERTTGTLTIPEIVLPAEAPPSPDNSNNNMADHHSPRRYSSPLLNASFPQPILESEEEEEEEETTPGNTVNSSVSTSGSRAKVAPPQSLPVPGKDAGGGCLRPDLSSPRFLCVDESKRPRAHSDPSVTVSAFADYMLPEITVTDDDDSAVADSDGVPGSTQKSRRGVPNSLNLLNEPQDSGRRRANTCPEDMFRPARKGRPATPPPTDVKSIVPSGKRRDRIQSAGGGVARRFTFNAAPPPVVIKSPTSVSFAHHKLCKVSEDASAESPPPIPDSNPPPPTSRDLQYKLHLMREKTATRNGHRVESSDLRETQSPGGDSHAQGDGSATGYFTSGQTNDLTSLRDSSAASSLPNGPIPNLISGANNLLANSVSERLSEPAPSFADSQSASTVLSDSIRTLTVCGKGHDVPRPGATGIPKDPSSPPWMSTDQKDKAGNGSLAAF